MKIRRECKFCGKVFYEMPCRIKKGYGKFCSRKCYHIWTKTGFQGKNNPAFGIKRPDLVRLNKSRIGIPIKEKTKEKQRLKILKYWQSKAGLKQREELSEINKKWAKCHPIKKLEAAKKGHKSCPRISSIELKLQNELTKQGINFIPQYEWEKGFIDIFIPPCIVIFADGDYWHSPQKAKDKDATQNLLLTMSGYKVFRFWEKDINKSAKRCVNKVVRFLKKKESYEKGK